MKNNCLLQLHQARSEHPDWLLQIYQPFWLVENFEQPIREPKTGSNKEFFAWILLYAQF